MRKNSFHGEVQFGLGQVNKRNVCNKKMNCLLFQTVKPKLRRSSVKSKTMTCHDKMIIRLLWSAVPQAPSVCGSNNVQCTTSFDPPSSFFLFFYCCIHSFLRFISDVHEQIAAQFETYSNQFKWSWLKTENERLNGCCVVHGKRNSISQGNYIHFSDGSWISSELIAHKQLLFVNSYSIRSSIYSKFIYTHTLYSMPNRILSEHFGMRFPAKDVRLLQKRKEFSNKTIEISMRMAAHFHAFEMQSIVSHKRELCSVRFFFRAMSKLIIINLFKIEFIHCLLLNFKCLPCSTFRFIYNEVLLSWMPFLFAFIFYFSFILFMKSNGLWHSK